MCHHGARFTMILSCFAMLLRWHQQLASISRQGHRRCWLPTSCLCYARHGSAPGLLCHAVFGLRQACCLSTVLPALRAAGGRHGVSLSRCGAVSRQPLRQLLRQLRCPLSLSASSQTVSRRLLAPLMVSPPLEVRVQLTCAP